MNVTLWIVQGLLAFAFIAVGAMKLFAYERFKAQSEKKGPTGIPRDLATFIGVAEVAGSYRHRPADGNQHRSVAQPVGRSRTLNHHAAGNWLSPAPPRVAGRARHPFLARSVCGVRPFFALEVRRGANAAVAGSVRITGQHLSSSGSQSRGLAHAPGSARLASALSRDADDLGGVDGPSTL
jgi:DoxX-like family